MNTESSNVKKQTPTLSAALPEVKTQTKASLEDDVPLYIILPTKPHEASKQKGAMKITQSEKFIVRSTGTSFVPKGHY